MHHADLGAILPGFCFLLLAPSLSLPLCLRFRICSMGAATVRITEDSWKMNGLLQDSLGGARRLANQATVKLSGKNVLGSEDCRVSVTKT